MGIDLGVTRLVVPSKGGPTDAPRSLRLHEKQLKLLQRELSRRIKGSRNWNETRLKIQRVHEKIYNVRRDVTHKLTADLVKNYRWIGIEDLNVKGMMKNRRLAKSVADASFYEVRRQLEYKSKLAGNTVVVADRFFPSSKMCSSCFLVFNALKLSQRRWTCFSCGVDHDRDFNAAQNLERLAAGYAARREGSSGATGSGVVKLSSMKRKSSISKENRS